MPITQYSAYVKSGSPVVAMNINHLSLLLLIHLIGSPTSSAANLYIVTSLELTVNQSLYGFSVENKQKAQLQEYSKGQKNRGLRNAMNKTSINMCH